MCTQSICCIISSFVFISIIFITPESFGPSGGKLGDILVYKKPSIRPEPVINPPATSDDIKTSSTPAYLTAKLLEKLYMMMRSSDMYVHEESSSFPPWGAFHVLLTRNQPTRAISNIAFNPIILAPPTNLNTVFTTLKRSKVAINNLGFEHTPIFFDMGLLSKALEVTWSCPAELKGVIPCGGGMHLLMSIFAGIGYLYEDAGLLSLLHESSVYAPGTAQHILSGKDFDRALRALRLVDEALNQRFMKHFKNWCNNKTIDFPEAVNKRFSQLHNSLEEKQDVSVQITELQALLHDSVEPLLEQFREEGREASPLFKFWDDFLQRVMLPLKIFLAATRNADWALYQSSKIDFLPLLFATNRTNYARYMPVEILMMQRLPEEVENAFKEGLFAAKISSGTFNGVWMDYTLEATENKELKGNGGIIGLTLKGPALERWFLSRPITAKYAATFKIQMSASSHPVKTHHLSTKAEKKRWDSDVMKMCNMFDGSYIDPFSIATAPAQLVNFATGVIANKEVEQSMLMALDKGEELAQKFISDRLVPAQDGGAPSKSFYAPLPRSGIKTMADLNKTVSIKGKKIVIGGEAMYLRLLAINANKKVPTDRVMSFENCPVPLSLFKEDGSIIAADRKSDFLHRLEALLPAQRITAFKTSGAAIIFDGHAVVQALPAPGPTTLRTFKDMAKEFLTYILQHSEGASQIHVVFDKYFENSIKSATRLKRGENCLKYHILLDGPIPKNWKTFLHSGENKGNLATCYTEYMCSVLSTTMETNQCAFISGGHGEKTIKVTKDVVQEELSMKSNMEEADGRIVFHAVHAVKNGARKIVVSSPDTDVCVLLLHHWPVIDSDELYFLTGREGKHTSLTRYIPIHLMHDKLNPAVRAILLSVYCLSGCDTVSSFYGKGKATAFRVMQQKSAQLQALSSLGTSTETDDAANAACVRFVGALYGKDDCKSVNSLRSERAIAGKNIAAKKLPPTMDSLGLHILRAVYQLLIWRNACVGMHDLPEPTDFGYENDGNSLTAKLMSQVPAAPELMNDLICICAPNSCHFNCACLNNQQPCTAACRCTAALVPDDNEATCNNFYTFQAFPEEEQEAYN